MQSQGSEALDLLQYLSSNDINQPIGTVIHTGMQNNRGGYENDCSIVPLTDNRYVLLYLYIKKCDFWFIFITNDILNNFKLTAYLSYRP